jgi:hypothetical protein
MVSADSAKTARKMAILARPCDDFVMPTYPELRSVAPLALYPLGWKTPISKCMNFRLIWLGKRGPLAVHAQPSMLSRRQCLAVAAMSTNARPSAEAADTAKSSGAIGSSLSTLVINKCWLSEGTSINKLWVFKE